MDDAKTIQKKVFVCGAGHQGLAMAAHLALNGLEVNLWNRTEKNVKKIINTKTIYCTGIVQGLAKISKISSNMAEVISDFVMVTTPSNAHKDIAREIAPYVNSKMVIVLNPGRTFGAIEFSEELKKLHVKEMPLIAETQTIVYTCRKTAEDGVNIFALKNDVMIATAKSGNIQQVIDAMPNCLKPYFLPVPSLALTSFSNIGMILHCAPVLMNIGWIECEKVEFKYYYDGISKTIATLLEKMDAERIAVARICGYEIESLKHWLERTYSINGTDLYDCLQKNEAYREIDAPPSVNSRYIFEDVPNGLVPIEKLGIELGVDTPVISTIINLACFVMNTDYRNNGRSFSVEMIKEYF